VVYGHAGGIDLALDTYRPDNDRVLPGIVWVHGGGWSAGDKSESAEGAIGYARQGYVCFSVNYRLAKSPANPWPAQLDDVQRAVRWIRAHADQYHLDAAHLGAIGGSAGGHLVACLGTMDTRDNSDPELAKYSSRVTCVVDMSGPSDLTADFASLGAQGAQAIAIMTNFFGGKTRDQAPDLYRDASPVFHIDDKTVPFLIFHGEADELVPVDQARRLDAALRKAGRESKLMTFPGVGHGVAGPEVGSTVAREALSFLQRHLKAPAAP
jgi:acetyl esterase/lipase